MRCPNCSYINQENSNECIACGYKFARAMQTPKSIEPESDTPSKPKYLTSDLDVETIKHLLKRSESTSDPMSESLSGNTSESKAGHEDVGAQAIQDTTEANDETQPNGLKIIFLTLAVLLVLGIFLRSSFSDMTWKYKSNKSQSTDLAATSSETTTESNTTEPNEAKTALEPIHSFFRLLPDYLNQNNLLILNTMLHSQEGVNLLSEYGSIGKLSKLTVFNVLKSDEREQNATYEIETLMDYILNGKEENLVVNWNFSMNYDGVLWKIDTFSYEVPSLNISSQPSTSEVAAESTTEQPKPEPKTEPKTETTGTGTTETGTEVELKGFKEAGGFSGGVETVSQDISAVRYGNHDDFERLVFDLSDWNYGNPTTPSELVGKFDATLSENQKQIIITLYNAADASVRQKGVNLNGSANVKSIQFAQGAGDSVQIIIDLNKPSQYKVFTMKSPGKIVSDIAIIK